MLGFSFPQPNTPRTPANWAALKLCLLLWGLTNFSPAVIFPFLSVVAETRTSSSVIIGVIFASQPAASFIMSPIVPLVMDRFGRIRTLSLGLIVCAIGCAGFGLTMRVDLWIFFHALEGVGNALVDVPSQGLLMTHSVDLAEDLGLQEGVAGLAYVVGPVFGGLIYAVAGFRNTFLLLAALHLVALAAVPITLHGLPSSSRSPVDSDYGDYGSITSITHEDSPSKASTASQLGTELKDSFEHKESFSEQTTAAKQPRNTFSVMVQEPAVWVAAVANTLAYASLTFYDAALPRMVRNTAYGFCMQLPCFVFAVKELIF